MKSFFTIVSLLFLFVEVQAQTTIDFESFNLSVDSSITACEGYSEFIEGDLTLPANAIFYGQSCFWGGWAISTNTDTLTPGFGNQFSSRSGDGNNASSSYAITYAPSGSSVVHLSGVTGDVVDGVYINNNSYAYYSILEGDAYAKKFGGPTGNDPDFFLLIVKGYQNGQLSTDSVNFYLADYRFADNSQDYIVKDWTYVDLSSLGQVDSLMFTLTSSDIGLFGMNTPAYFCMDDLSISPSTSVFNTPQSNPIQVFPNPAQSQVTINWTDESTFLSVFDLNGRLVKQLSIRQGQNQLTVQDLIPGNYLLRAVSENGVYSGKLIIQP